ncbi:MAG: 23S rRNA (pseudouridine(1915)-N(3))-methyltransferase RlmH [Oscillospiraceae bacterium]|nr:23S rRNA (pseudouridine(1915)-N(3))-methyltransferase RlmH [Oscillospiraceae bacterium]MDY4586492.1 23S rRNA (pseudouridine(1915)-N(3))-methyltransferase RlmH [Oscillospiraceae bacterium]
MINVTLITLGKVQKGFLTDGCNEYIKRLRTMCDFKLVEIEDEPLPEKNLNQTLIDKALEKEGGKIISAIPKQSYVIAMCIEGKQLASRDFAKLFNQKAVEGYSSICLIIGSSHGLSEKVKARRDLRMSFSKMTFPHQLFRLMALEQIYRAFSINAGTKYHK